MPVAAGDGTELYVAVPSSGAADVAIGQVVSVTPHGGSVGTYDVTNLDTTGNREFTKTIGAGDTLDFTINYDPTNAGQVVCQSLVATPNTGKWTVVLPTTASDYVTFFGVLTAFGAEQVTVDNVHMRTISVQISSTWTYGTGY